MRHSSLPRRVLYVEGCRDGTVGGSHVLLLSMVANFDRAHVHPLVAFYDDHHVAQEIRELGADVFVFPNRKPIDLRALIDRHAPWLGGPHWTLIPLQKAINFVRHFLVPAIRHALFLRAKAVDIVHLNNSINGNHEWMLGALLARVPFISHERGISEQLSRTSRRLGGRADSIICMSRQIRDALVRQGLNGETSIVIYDGIDTEHDQARQDPEELRASHAIGPEDPVIGVVGNIKKWKGQETVVRAVALLKERWPRLKCLLVGTVRDDDPYCVGLRRLVDDLGVTEHVIFTGFRVNPADYINAMNIFVHSSIEPEPFGRVNIEAMYLGKPVVSTNIGGPTEIFEDGYDGVLIEPGVPVLLAQHIASLLEAPELRTRLGENARRTVMERFTIRGSVRAIQEIYERVLVRAK